ncbi:2-amino-4-hydroxy-6-hydroxymethyldihydropteridine diphosphokinase [Maritimibacter sp. UBA3975]|uniref:2-amino-4-hydroxy-6- hydroxymethyldihydropteridine diphosphokinase n=1 Tax=Maritimibacter sp. UBA3975 TaxID=1946833 RepID=UPI000C0916C9|nr:2-amino-4-hydroxy-6-hydroxymethyldihydropteridine diphosphokinase [Maritimibacter sp. UBA3975]MAM61898.1 2-amino-4-hydroxy-6-hydroxymethyldihydropteridine diphosphokinase [Maritimibacter sp.]|tara:strand:+ start:7668 stop:8270 length:603 start_codon:yes stop_codon:yes gene_type:complete
MTQPYGEGLRRDNALVCLGSNATSHAGGPVETLRAALKSLDDGPVKIVRTSRFFVSPFVPAGSEPDVVNAVVALATDLKPNALLTRLHEIEADFDRRREVRWTSRTLDLDLIAIGESILPDPSTLREWVHLPPDRQKSAAPDRLILPHPRMQDRAFVLVPMADIAPDWRHPLSGRTVRDMLDDLPPSDIAAVTPVESADG